MIKVACREQFPVKHPKLDYPGVDILAFCGEPSPGSGAHARNAVVMSNTVLDWHKPETWTAMLDRSPCGTGTCAIMAVLHARGALQVGQAFVHESIIGTTFTGTILKETTIHIGKDGGGNGEKIAIVPQNEGSAYLTQYSQVVVDSEDPFPHGYQVSDIW
jgi:proline racemase